MRNFGKFFAWQKNRFYLRAVEDVRPYGYSTAEIIANYRL